MAITYPFVRALLDERRAVHPAVLEIGCGSQQYRADAGPGHVGLDVAGPLRPPAVRASAERIPLASGAFDLVFGVATFYMIPDIDAALAECHRVLRPRGRILVVDYQPAVIARLEVTEGGARHRWSATDLLARLHGAGFRDGCDLSNDVADSRLRRAARRLRGQPGGPVWLIVEATS